jgi:hypothetical protein
MHAEFRYKNLLKVHCLDGSQRNEFGTKLVWTSKILVIKPEDFKVTRLKRKNEGGWLQTRCTKGYNHVLAAQSASVG